MTDTTQRIEPLSAEEEAKVRTRAGQSVTWLPGTMDAGYRVPDALHHAVHDRDALLATLDRDRSAAKDAVRAAVAILEHTSDHHATDARLTLLAYLEQVQ